MKLIDLLNKIANGEEVPKKIRITDIDNRITKHYNFFYDEDDQEYKDDELFPLGARLILDRVLNEKVEIIEEEKETKPLTKKNIEALGYACGEIQKCFTSGWTKSLENKPLEEEKKIPEKLGTINYIEDKTTALIHRKVDEIIDYLNYLENKGE